MLFTSIGMTVDELEGVAAFCAVDMVLEARDSLETEPLPRSNLSSQLCDREKRLPPSSAEGNESNGEGLFGFFCL